MSVPGYLAPQAPPGRLLADLAPEEALARLRLTIVRRLDGYLRGEHAGLVPGPGTELGEARVYRAGEDDVRHIDWAVTARTTTPHVRDLIADRELETYALIDLTASMYFGTAVQPGWSPDSEQLPRAWDKRDLAVAAVATIGTLTGRQGDRFGGYVLTADGLRRHPAAAGRSALYSMVRSLLRDEAEAGESAAEGMGGARHTAILRHSGPATSLAQAIDRIARAHPRRGLRVVVSDFLEPEESGGGEPAWTGPMRSLAQRHQVLAVQVVDPLELDLPDAGVLDLMDPESGDVIEVDTSDPDVRSLFAAQSGLNQDRVASSLRHAGCAHLVLSTDSDWVRDVARFVLAHRRIARRLHGTTGARR
ncbi:MAG: DUF58 domain-containing protein [Micrococcales bacterium]|nr:MAG: DUF58 domain-containing protein [Micrococcales bacterium]